jgi:hypothetical protein
MCENDNEIKIVFPNKWTKLAYFWDCSLFYTHFMTTIPWQNTTGVRRGILDGGNPLEMLLSTKQSANNPKKILKNNCPKKSAQKGNLSEMPLTKLIIEIKIRETTEIF